MRRLPITVGLLIAVDSLTSGAVMAQPASARADSRRDCAVCHLEWVDAFEMPEATLLIDPPTEASAAKEDTCLGCHDGSVADSRNRVWREHGHKTGIVPPETMKVPRQLPLTDGKIACRTCHTAHSGTGPEGLAGTVFVRVRNDASQLCQMCHPDHTKGPELGTHPIGGMPWEVPDELIAAGAQIGPDRYRLFCQTCHTPHGSSEEHLLVMGTDSSELCQTCHKKLRPGLWRPELGREHPQNPPLSNDAQRRAIAEMGTKTGRGETIICLSCHKLHHGLSGRRMLADTLTDSRLCLRCHPGRENMTGNDHDLRTSAPNERNRLGQTAAESGPCGACHSFHQFARRPDPQPTDATGLCATCHQAGQCAEKATGLPFSHPSDVHEADLPADSQLVLYPALDLDGKKTMACLTCHDPHEPGPDHFLRAEPVVLCSSCHVDQVDSLVGAHDFTRHPGIENGRSLTGAETGKCGFCHGVHDAIGPMMWVATPEAPDNANDFCVTCHRAVGMAADKLAGALRHPTGPETSASTYTRDSKLPLFDADGQKVDRGAVACSTCHDPHGSSAASMPSLLRSTGLPPGDPFCLNCHRDMRSVLISRHNERIMQGDCGKAHSCEPCHVAHARPGMPATGMWAAPQGSDAYPPDVRLCMGCHGPTGDAVRVTRPADHPDLALQNVNSPEAAGFLPLVNEQGDPDPNGRISCITCHLPHGRPPDETFPLIDPAEMTSERHRAIKPMIRPYRVPNLCSSCHGLDGLRRFLHYHQPPKRGEYHE